MKQGEVQQVFIYLMVIIVVGTLMLVGYNSISDILNKSCDVGLSTFKIDLKGDLLKNSNSEFVQTVNYKVPCNYEQVCFVDLDRATASISNEVIRAEVIADTGRNIFFIKKGVTEDANFAYEGIEVNTANGVLCVSAKGNAFTLRMEGVSRGKVRVSSPNAPIGPPTP